MKDEGNIKMSPYYTGLEYNDIIFIDSAAKPSTQNVFSEATLSSDDEQKFTLAFPLQLKQGKIN